MKVVLAIDGDRISPVLDAARCFLLVTARPDGALIHRKEIITDEGPVTKAKSIIELGGTILICGAISWPLEVILTSAGMRVKINFCGPMDEVLEVFLQGP
jgi:hypothetical protein